jgi:hypothetical protein
MTGLIKSDCPHDRQEFREFKQGEEWLICLDCGEWVMRYQDTQGG